MRDIDRHVTSEHDQICKQDLKPIRVCVMSISTVCNYVSNTNRYVSRPLRLLPFAIYTRCMYAGHSAS